MLFLQKAQLNLKTNKFCKNQTNQISQNICSIFHQEIKLRLKTKQNVEENQKFSVFFYFPIQNYFVAKIL